MTLALLMYFVHVNAGIAFFYLLYKWLCTRDTFFAWRRGILLLFIISAFVLPLPVNVFVMTEYSEFLQLLKKEIEYPQSVSDKGVQGMVIVQFEVERDGTPDRFKIIHSVSPELDAEVLRAFRLMSHWKFATGKKRLANGRFTVPVTFTQP